MAKHTPGPGPAESIDAWHALDDILTSAGAVVARREPGEYTHREISAKYGWSESNTARVMGRLLAQGHVTRRQAIVSGKRNWVYQWIKK